MFLPLILNPLLNEYTNLLQKAWFLKEEYFGKYEYDPPWYCSSTPNCGIHFYARKDKKTVSQNQKNETNGAHSCYYQLYLTII